MVEEDYPLATVLISGPKTQTGVGNTTCGAKHAPRMARTQLVETFVAADADVLAPRVVREVREETLTTGLEP